MTSFRWYHKVLFLMGRVGALFYRFLPRFLQLFLSDILAFLWFDIVRLRRSVAISNIQLAYPELSEKEVRLIARRSYKNLCRSVLEYFLLIHMTKKDLNSYFEFQGLENLDAAIESQKGFFLLTLHLGNGDLGLAGMALLGYKLNLVSKRFKSEWLNDAWYGLRERLGTKLLIEEKTHFDILRILRSGGGVAFVLDQYMGPPVGTRTHFFDRVTGTAMGPAVFVQRTGALVLPAYCYRNSRGKISVVIEEPIPFEEKASKEKTIRHMTQVYTNKVEEIVRAYPDQWMWIHRRWKRFRD